MTLSNALANVNELFTCALNWAKDTLGMIVNQPILMLFLLVPFVGLGIGILRRIIRL